VPQTHIHLDGLSAEARYRYEPVEPSTPEQLSERRWAMTLLDTALQRLKTESAQAGHASLFSFDFVSKLSPTAAPFLLAVTLE
jgi:hypothetical protein